MNKLVLLGLASAATVLPVVAPGSQLEAAAQEVTANSFTSSDVDFSPEFAPESILLDGFTFGGTVEAEAPNAPESTLNTGDFSGSIFTGGATATASTTGGAEFTSQFSGLFGLFEGDDFNYEFDSLGVTTAESTSGAGTAAASADSGILVFDLDQDDYTVSISDLFANLRSTFESEVADAATDPTFNIRDYGEALIFDVFGADLIQGLTDSALSQLGDSPNSYVINGVYEPTELPSNVNTLAFQFNQATAVASLASDPEAVPEPMTLLGLGAVGLVGAGSAIKRKRSAEA